MAEKYEGLVDKISDVLEPGLAGYAYIRNALRWLDTNPYQVPGRTITHRQRLSLIDGEDQNFLRGFEAGLSVAGCTVVPDPEPTNAEKLETLLEGGDINAQWGLRGGGVMFARELAHALDEAGVKAPGGDE